MLTYFSWRLQSPLRQALHPHQAMASRHILSSEHLPHEQPLLTHCFRVLPESFLNTVEPSLDSLDCYELTR